MDKKRKDLLITICIMAAAFSLSLATDQMSQTDMLIPMFFVLGVFLISVVTTGYLWGISASLISVLAVNYAFTFNFPIEIEIRYRADREDVLADKFAAENIPFRIRIRARCSILMVATFFRQRICVRSIFSTNLLLRECVC